MTLPLPFTAPWLLAPMEGVTEACFRDLVLSRNPQAYLGGAFTEFISVVDHPLRRSRIAAALAGTPAGRPVGVQLMGSNLEALEATAASAASAGAPVLDINFGCPTKGTLRTCAGSALLRDPSSVEKIISVCVRGVNGKIPVTAKIRAGFDDDLLLEDLARAAEGGGSSMLTVHCRTREEGYRDCADWRRVERAVASVNIPICGNGGVERHGGLERMRRETGCAFVMVGRAALRDPWIFCGKAASAGEASEFLLDYAAALRGRGGFHARAAAARVKQLIHFWEAGGLFTSGRDVCLRETDPDLLLDRIAAAGANHIFSALEGEL